MPFAERTKSSSERVTLITLSVKFMLESIVRLETLTTPVPPGDRFKSAFELVPIILSLKVRLSMVVVPTKDEAPETVNVDSVVAPVTSSVELIVTAEDRVGAPAFSVPSTIKFSFMLMVVESVPTIDVPANPIPSITTLPDPLAVIFNSSFDLVILMLLSSTVRAGNTMFPVPEGLSTMSALEDFDTMLFCSNLISDATAGNAKNSVKLALILRPAFLIVSPVPSSANAPMLIRSLQVHRCRPF